MHLTGKQMGLMSKIMLAFAESHREGQIREIVGDLVMQLLQAQYYASFVWHDESASFGEAIQINMDPANISQYETYYQFINDDLTPRRQSPASRSIEACFPFAEAARLRRRHGARVHQALAGHPVICPLWPALPSQVVPFGIAVTVVGHRRDEVQRRLFDDDVLASTLADKWDFVPPGGEARFPVERAFLRDHLLLPVSEFMSDDDTSRLIDALQRIN